MSNTDRKYNQNFVRENTIMHYDENGLRYKLGPILHERGYTIKSFSEATETRENTIRDFIRGKAKRIPATFLAKACEELNCDISDLIDFPNR